MSTQLIDFESGSPTTGDSGERTATAAIKPIVAGERVHSAVVDRSLENLRARTEELRGKVEDLLYRADADKWIITGGNNMGAVVTAFPTVNWNSATGIFTMSAHAVIQPFMAPSTDKFAAQTYVFTTGTTDTFVISANDDALAGDILYDYQLANSIRIIWETAALGVGVFCTATLEGSPSHILRIVIRNDNQTTAADVRTALNLILGPVTPASPLKFTLTGPGTTVLDLTDIAGYTDVVMTGTYSRELHYLSTTELSNFITAPGNNLSVDGDGIGIWYEELTDSDPALHGGRRQATPTTATDVAPNLPPNTEVPSTKLFKFSTEPSKIPGAIPLCRRIGTYLVFVDGTVVPTGQTTTFGSHGSLDALIAAYAAHVAGSADNHGADDITFDETNLIAWLVLAAGQADTVQEAIDQMVICLANANKGALLWPYAGNSFIGAEAVTDAPTSLVRGTVDSQTTAMLAAVNDRVSMTVPSTVVAAHQHLTNVSHDIESEYLWNSPFIKGMRGTFIHPRGTVSQAIQGFWNPTTGSVVHPYRESPDIGAADIAGIVPVIVSAADATYVNRVRRRLVIISGTAGSSAALVYDPSYLGGGFTSTTLSTLGLPTGGSNSWAALAACPISDTRFAVVFQNAGIANPFAFRVQAYEVQDDDSVIAYTAWTAVNPTGVVLPVGIGSITGKGTCQIIKASTTRLAVSNSWVWAGGTGCISILNSSTGAITGSGDGSLAAQTCIGQMVSDGTYVYVAAANSTPAYSIENALISDPSLSSAGTIPAFAAPTTGACTAVGFDGTYVWGITQDNQVLYYDTVNGTGTGLAAVATNADVSRCIFDGRYLWCLATGNNWSFADALDPGEILPGVSSQDYTSFKVKRVSVNGNGTAPAYGAVAFDGDSIWYVADYRTAQPTTGMFGPIRNSAFR